MNLDFIWRQNRNLEEVDISVFHAKDSVPLESLGAVQGDCGSKENPFGDTYIKQFPSIPLRNANYAKH